MQKNAQSSLGLMKLRKVVGIKSCKSGGKVSFVLKKAANAKQDEENRGRTKNCGVRERKKKKTTENGE